MKILYLSNNDISLPLLRFLRDIKKEDVLYYPQKLALADIETIKPNLLISYNYKFILSKSILNAVHGRAINLHISLLPWNRGAHPNLWSCIEDTPKGVTIHLIDKGLDTGDILLQEKIEIDEKKETLESSYLLLHRVIQKLFMENWENLREERIDPRPQTSGGSIHYVKDFQRLEDLLGKIEWHTPIDNLKNKFNQIQQNSREIPSGSNS